LSPEEDVTREKSDVHAFTSFLVTSSAHQHGRSVSEDVTWKKAMSTLLLLSLSPPRSLVKRNVVLEDVNKEKAQHAGL
jgi:hypothetical protein